ncbi:SpoIIE family protein phosphatase [Kitasatospora sp. NPDC002965]|uniref:SpoIIE family protein phosphatase n=1 Tax=Kitasatospora sp. NPDC002965 TaxID=3154775 RepID=UPI0033BAFA25
MVNERRDLGGPGRARRDEPGGEPGAGPHQDALLMVPIATALIESDGRILHWSNDAEALLGYSPEEAIGARAAQLLAPDDQRPEVLELFQEILDGRGWSGVFPVRHRDGHHVNLEFRTHPIAGPGGSPLVLAVASDVTTLRRIQADLAVLDGFFTQSPVGMGVFDSRLAFVRLNEALARVNGLPVDRHVGSRLTELLPGIDGEESEAVMRRVLETGEPVLDARSHGRTPGDPTHEHAWSASYFRLEDPSGRVLGVSSTVIDITERFRADARAARAQERLALLVDASASIGTTLDLRQTARELADAMVPRVADISGVFALEALAAGRTVEPLDPSAPQQVRRLALATTDPLYPAEALPVDAVYEVAPESPYARALATGRTVVVPSWELPPLSNGISESRRQAYLGDRPRSVRITPLVARGTTLGMIVYSRRGERESFAEADITLGDELASRAAVAIDNARLYLRQHQIVLARQQALREAKAAQERLALVNVASTRIGTTLDLAQTALELAEVATPRLADTVVVEVLDDLVRGEREARPSTDGSAVLRRMAFHSAHGSTLEPIDRTGGVQRFLPGSPYAWALTRRRPVLVPRMDEAGMAWFANDPVRTAAVHEQNVRSFMVVPLIARGSPVGVAAFYRTVMDHPYEDDDLALAGELSVRAAVAIDNALLFTRERDAAAARQRALDEAWAAQQRLSLLNEASTRIGTTLDLDRTSEELVEVVIPRFADFVTVDLRDAVLGGEDPSPVPADGSVLMRAVAVGEAAADGTMSRAADQVGTTSQSAQVYAESLRTGRSILVSEVDEAALRRIVASEDRVQPGLDAGVHSYLMVPLLARGLVLGGVEFIRTRNPLPFGAADRSLAEELAARTALAIDNGRLYRRERETALTLQRSLLPQEIHRTLGLEIAYRYLPSSVVSEVGGDWFDVVPLSSGRVALVVGDVMGHGIRAAATMGQLRTVARTLITLELSPDRVMHRLDEATTAIGEGQFATCVCVVYDPVGRHCTASCAGHLPPVVGDGRGGARLVELPPGAPLGVGGVPFESVEFTLPEDGLLALYTDGLVERRGRDLDEGLDLLCRTIAAGTHRSPEQTCDAVLAELTGRTSEDDIAVIIAQARPVGSDRIATLPLGDDHAMVAHSRRFTRETLGDWGLGALADWAELLTSELITNALVHAGSPTQLRLLCNRTLTVEVADQDAESPRMRRAREEDEGGRGIHLVNELAHRWGSRKTPDGKVVWFELELPPGLVER